MQLKQSEPEDSAAFGSNVPSSGLCEFAFMEVLLSDLRAIGKLSCQLP